MAYITASDIKEHLSIDSSGDDTYLGKVAARAQGYMEKWTDRAFEVVSDSTKYFDALADVYPDEYGANRILLVGKKYDLCAITSITNGDGVALAAGDYVTDPRGETPYRAIRIKSGSSVSWTYETSHENAIAVVGKWAYSLTPPQDVINATLELAAYIYRRRGVEGSGLDRVMVSPSGVTMAPPGLPEGVKRVLIDRRRWWKGW